MSSDRDEMAAHERFAHLPTRTFAEGETVISSGSSTGKLFVLQCGRVEVVQDGLVLGTFDQPGIVFGELAALLDQPHSADVRALAPSTFHVADAAELLGSDPALTLHVAIILARRLHGANEALVDVRNQLADGAPRRSIGEALDRLRHAMNHDRYHDLTWQ